LAAEFREYRIDINAIAPGPVNTNFLDEALAAGKARVGEERYQALLRQKEEGGVGTEKVAALCLFLASGDSDGLSGRIVSAVWDKWESWDKKKIGEIMKKDAGVLRRIKP
jgi:NAD(P)-dependent dehydrogenase (short-subunit alcohol dehydrogenase family)